MLWTCSGFYPIFIYICIKVQMLLTLWKPCVMSSLTSCLCSLNCLSYGDVIYGTTCLYSFSCVSCGVVICGISIVYMATCTIVNIALTNVGTTDGSIPPLIIFSAFRFVLSYSLFIPELEVPPSSTLFFLLKTLLGESVIAFFLFFCVVYISSLVLLTLANGFCGFSF